MTSGDALRDLGVRASAEGGVLRVWSHSATSMRCEVFEASDATWAIASLEMARDAHGVWSAESPELRPGRLYALRVDGPTGPNHAFDPRHRLLDPYARGLVRAPGDGWRSAIVDAGFDWGDSAKPRVPLDHTVLYETHVRGFSRRNPDVPAHLRGTYAGLAHESSIAYLQDLGVTTLELLPVHAFVPERRLLAQGLTNYWGYNTLGFFAPHAAYASPAAQAAGPAAVLREFQGMVRLLHEAGLEVVLDVVYNHTAEEGPHGPAYHLRGIDNAGYYRQDAHGAYVDTTGCGNTLYFGGAAPVRLVLDSMRYWAGEVGVDGFRLDLAASLGRGQHGDYSPDHPLLRGMLDDPVIGASKLIAEPWDVGWGGWQTGNFPAGFSEWNDGYRDRIRDFWLGDLRRQRRREPVSGIGTMATSVAGSAHAFAADRGPLASVNFITAHDGFTLADLVSYDVKHNLGNGEDNRDGTNDNRSYNHGVEGPTDDAAVRADRQRSIRNLLGTLLLSAGVPMLTAGDEHGRTQRGNNNAYCQDGELTWLDWERQPWEDDLLAVARHLIRLRRENPALRPDKFGRFGETTPGATQMDWYNAHGEPMAGHEWDDPKRRTLQYLAASTPQHEPFNRVLLVFHGRDRGTRVTLPTHAGVSGYTRLWDSSRDTPSRQLSERRPGDAVRVRPASIQVFRAH
ncbi:glycogen debranching protein GlgX [Agromyces sp. SYSU T00194]|uniref:glycogen debranching protein GlgX n=1 Tax=Agromyces chitinivorans TaxID=3158560 RepID=UPI003397D157